LAEYTTIHGTFINIFGTGVLIQGESGVGKSETALELIKRGHIFIADDAVDITNLAGRLFGKANIIAGNFIEVRGVGILNVSRMYGIEKTAPSSNIDVVIELAKITDMTEDQNFERIGTKNKTKNIMGTKIPYYRLPITPGRNMADLIETVVIDLKLKNDGYNSAQEYIDNYEKAVK